MSWEQRATEGNPRYEKSQGIPDVRYSQFAELLGLKGIFVDSPEALRAAWEDALASDRPVVLEVKTDPNVPPLPPHITASQAKAFLAAYFKGDRILGKVIRRSVYRGAPTR